MGRDHQGGSVTAAVGFSFNDLSERAQQRAIDDARYSEVDSDYDWWDSVYEDAVRMAALLGIEIDQHDGKPHGYAGPKIYFSGFCSQGDGACFQGTYRPKSDAFAAVKAECNDETLISLAKRLTTLNVESTLHHEVKLCYVTVSAYGRYSHSNTMSATYEYDADVAETDSAFEDDLLACLREFADWIYNQLEAEFDYLTSDEVVRERLIANEYVFDEDGAMI